MVSLPLTALQEGIGQSFSCGVHMKPEPRSSWWKNDRQYSDWILGTVFFTTRTVRQWDRGPEFLNTLSLQVFKTQLPKALSNLISFKDDFALARLLEVEMPKTLPSLNCSMILQILDIFFSKGMEEKSPSAVHQRLQSPCPYCGTERQASLCMDTGAGTYCQICIST